MTKIQPEIVTVEPENPNVTLEHLRKLMEIPRLNNKDEESPRRVTKEEGFRILDQFYSE